MTDISLQRYRVTTPGSPMKAAAHDDAESTNECRYGELVQLTSGGDHEQHHQAPASEQASHSNSSPWVYVKADRDDYIGYMRTADLQALDSAAPASTHWVCARSTLVFTEPSIKSRVVTRLPFLSRVVSQSLVNGSFQQLDSGGYLWNQHLLTTGECLELAPIRLAQSHFLGAPYLWGGCSPDGLDCSGLIQALAQAKGIRIPRDSADQEQALKHDIAAGDKRSQDLVYWPGHTGILLDANTLLHSTAHCLSCVVEPLHDVIQRAGQVSSIKRLFE